MEIKFCESCLVAGIETEATGYSTNPDWSGYALCQECIAEYDAHPQGVIEAGKERAETPAILRG